jgi:hypothetical protein
MTLSLLDPPFSRGVWLLFILGFAGVLRASTWLGKVRVGGFQYRILIPVSELALHGSIAGPAWFCLFHSAF